MKQKKVTRLMAVVLSGALLMGNALVPSAMEGETVQQGSAEELILEEAQTEEQAEESSVPQTEPEDAASNTVKLEVESIETVAYQAENDPQAESDSQAENNSQAASAAENRQVNKQEAEIRVGAQQILKFTMPETAQIEWRSSDDTIAVCGTALQRAGETEGTQEYSCMVTGEKTGECTIEAYSRTENTESTEDTENTEDTESTEGAEKTGETVYAAFKVSVLPYHVSGCVGTQISFNILSGTFQQFDFTCEEEDVFGNPLMEEVSTVKDGGQTLYTYSYHVEAKKLYDGALKAVGQSDSREISISMTVNSHPWNETPTIIREATCSKPGLQHICCSACGAVKKDSEQEIPCIPHTWNADFTVEEEPTCSKPGHQNIHCNVCGAVKEGSDEEIPRKPHTWNAERTIDKTATCTESGVTSIHCKDCDAVQEGSQVLVQATGHLWGDWKQIAAPAIKTEGKDQRTCVRCNATVTRSTGKLPVALEKVKMNTPVVVSGDHIKLSWQAVPYADGYTVYRKKGSKWVKLATLQGNVLEYTDKNTKIGTTYAYSVRGYVTVNGTTVYSPSLKPGISVEQKFYEEPVKMREAKSLSTRAIKIRWAGRKKSSGYVIYRKIPGKSWEKLATVGKVASYTDKTCDSAMTYQYAVKAYTKNGKKTIYSKMEKIGVAAITKMHRPKLTVKSPEEDTAVLTWTTQPNVGGYVIYRKEGSKGKWVKIKRMTAKASSFTDEDVESGKTYYYIVKAYKKAKPKVGIMDPVYSNYYKKKVKIK